MQKLSRRDRIKKSIRKKVKGTPEKPRISVYRSNTSMYVQAIDDLSQRSLLYVSSRTIFKDKRNMNIESAKQLGKIVAERAAEKNIKSVVFDRNGFAYHGQIKAMAESMRAHGLQF